MDKRQVGWVITNNMVGGREVSGPKSCTLTKEELLKGHPFRMLSDDGDICYEGYLVGDKDSEEGFLPLDNFGTADGGCTAIQYKNSVGNYQTL